MKSKYDSQRFAAPVSLLILAALLSCGCGNEPDSPPSFLRGDVEITGVIMPDSSMADSIQITLDDELLGPFANPHLCENLAAGTHLIEVSAQVVSETTVIEYSGAQTVTILPDTTIQRQFALLGLAPDFALTEFDGDSVWMDSLEGKIVLLYFFVST